MIYLVPYNMGSNSCKLLKEALEQRGIKTLRIPHDSPRDVKPEHLMINWGSSAAHCDLNKATSVKAASNKLNTFEQLSIGNVYIPEWTTSSEVAQGWFDDGERVVCRTILNSHSGRGIVLSSKEDQVELVTAPLYVKYKKKRKEFRVHVCDGLVIDVVQKKKRSDFEEEVNPFIRNHSNGWVFCREDITEPEELRSIAVSAVSALELDFGAVDIIWNEHENKCYVLEINTAPGLEGTTVTNYANSIEAYYRRNS